ncbi:MAG TPA: TIGR03435 family protein [Acidobacteriaceae bacterium]|nr:TIGR03435 family protein [Acidobacteriaceae bacterium]
MGTEVASFLRYLILPVAALGLQGAVPAQAQTQPAPTQLAPAQPSGRAAPLQFEVVSIRPHPYNGDEPSNRQFLPGGRFVATATTAGTLLRMALMTDNDHMQGAPGWVNDELFDITAVTADHSEPKTPEQFQQMLLSLLQERFQLRFHREQKEGPVYWLELAKPGVLGPALKRSPDGIRPNLSMNGGARVEMNAIAMSTADIAAALRRQAGRPVEDHTGLNGLFDFHIQWSKQQTQPMDDAAAPGLFTVLEQELGLRLRPAKGMIETVVIDRMERPSGN